MRPTPEHLPESSRAPRRGVRRALVLVVALAASVLTTSALSPAASAAVVNGTFETGTTGWTASPTGSTNPLSRVSGGHSGSYSARISNVTSSSSTVVLNDAVNSVSSTVAGQTYRASAWMRAGTAGTTLVLRASEWAGSTAGASVQKTYWATDTAWHQLTVEVKASRTGASVDLNALAWDVGAGKSIYVDDISLSAVATSTSTSTSPVSSATSAIFPAQGTGALFGYYQSGGADPRPMETKIGRKFDLVHHYDDFNSAGNPWPTSAEKLEASQGRTVHVTWELVSYNGGYDSSLQPAPALTVDSRRIWTYKQVLNGSLDRYIDRTADRVKATPYRYVVDFNHEMDDLPDVGGSGKVRAAAGTRAEYKAAYRRIVDRFRARGVSNVSWAWTVSGWTAADSTKAWSLQQLWPGSSYVDVIMWDPYNYRPDRWKTFSQMVSPFYNAVRRGLLDPVDTRAKTLPMGLAEYGCVADSRRPAWLRSMATEVKAFPGIVSLGYFSSGTWGALHNDSTAISAFADAGRATYFHKRP